MDDERRTDNSPDEADMSPQACRTPATDRRHASFTFDPYIDAIWTTYQEPLDPSSADAVPIDFASATDADKVSLWRFQKLLLHAEHVASPNPKVLFYFLANRAPATDK